MARASFSVNIFFALLEFSSQQAFPIQIKQSRTNYGPDGPWHAVSVSIGSPGQPIDLLPGGTFQSQILTTYACQNQPNPCGSAGLFNPEASSSFNDRNINFGYINPGENASTTSGCTNGALMYQSTSASSVTDTLVISDGIPTKKITVGNFDIYMWSNVQILNPSGSHYPLQIGQLALGSSYPNQTFVNNGHGHGINAALVPNDLKQQSIIDSSSFGLHYGSASLGLDLSLWLGGYDQLRALEPVSAQTFVDASSFLIDLYDIGIGVAAGQSPFADAPSEGLLASGNDTLSDSYHGTFQVLIDPVAPYLNLPNSTCNAIARNLPVTYNAKYGLYLWNVNDPRYTKIVTSPAYLNFTFPLNGGSSNFAIRVPFQLLNLTLESPLIAEPTQYFPCQPPQDPAVQLYSLGRAFLQAAFLGANWDENHWYLAQAPGPGVSSNPNYQRITGSLGFVPSSGDSDTWAYTWNKTWTVTPGAASATQILPQALSKGGLPGGAIAGIAIGAVSGVALVITIGWLLYRRRQHATKAEAVAYVPDPDEVDPSQAFGEEIPKYPNSGFAPSELGHEGFVLGPSELNGAERYEMQHPSDRPSELAGSRARVIS